MKDAFIPFRFTVRVVISVSVLMGKGSELLTAQNPAVRRTHASESCCTSMDKPEHTYRRESSARTGWHTADEQRTTRTSSWVERDGEGRGGGVSIVRRNALAAQLGHVLVAPSTSAIESWSLLTTLRQRTRRQPTPKSAGCSCRAVGWKSDLTLRHAM
eukprot:4985150-Prymnesium_polylepis.1